MTDTAIDFDVDADDADDEVYEDEGEDVEEDEGEEEGEEGATRKREWPTYGIMRVLDSRPQTPRGRAAGSGLTAMLREIAGNPDLHSTTDGTVERWVVIGTYPAVNGARGAAVRLRRFLEDPSAKNATAVPDDVPGTWDFASSIERPVGKAPHSELAVKFIPA